MTEQDLTPDKDDDTKGHVRAPGIADDDDTEGHVRAPG